MQNGITCPEIFCIVFIHFEIGKYFFNILVILSIVSAKIKSHLRKSYRVVKTGKLRVGHGQSQRASVSLVTELPLDGSRAHLKFSISRLEHL